MTSFFTIPFSLNPMLNFFLLCLGSFGLLFVCFRVIICKNLLELILLMSIFSILISICYLFMDAPDVAMTETALGAGLSTCVLLNLIKPFKSKTENNENDNLGSIRKIWATIICIILLSFLTFIGLNLPLYGDENTVIHQHLSKYYLENAKNDIGIPSIVAAILASYRGYDTLGEATVILIAGLGVSLILATKKNKK